MISIICLSPSGLRFGEQEGLNFLLNNIGIVPGISVFVKNKHKIQGNRLWNGK